MATEAVFSVSLFKEKGKIKTNLVKNAIKRISTKLTWEDLLDMCIENVSEDDLPDDIVDKFSKLATVEVSASPTEETFKPDNTEFIKVLYDFDKTLKYVKMTFKLDLLEEYSGLADTSNNAPKKKDAFAIMIFNKSTKFT